MSTTGFILRLTQRTIPKWAIGVAVATPVVAIAQGCLMLDEFRNHHGHAPRPVIPSRGVVVVRSDDGNNHSFQLEPLRLLVIGDSLAAGVGVSDSGTPVLPEAIAKALSRALNGRAVFWTCVGTPGASSSQILRELQSLEERKNHNHHDMEGDDDEEENTKDHTNVLETKFAEWKNTKQDDHDDDDNNEENKKETLSPSEKDIVAKAKELVKNPIVKLVHKVQTKVEQVAEQIIHRRRTAVVETAIVSQYVSQYDIAIVLTGLNDLKKAYIPFMTKEDSPEESVDEQVERANDTDILTVVPVNHTSSSNSGSSMDDDMSRIVNAVQRKMRPGRPLVVFPAIPTSSVPVFQQAPLNWFLIPLLQKIDQHKKALAEKFPGLVLFVEAPSSRDLSEVEEQRGPLWASRQTEKVLLKLTDVTHNVREKVEQLMKQHYQAWTKDAEEGDDKKDDDDDDSLFCNDSNQVEWSYNKIQNNNGSSNKTSGRPGSTLIAPDRVHPNDLGYDIWGRHIAAAIVHSMNRNE